MSHEDLRNEYSNHESEVASSKEVLTRGDLSVGQQEWSERKLKKAEAKLSELRETSQEEALELEKKYQLLIMNAQNTLDALDTFEAEELGMRANQKEL